MEVKELFSRSSSRSSPAHRCSSTRSSCLGRSEPTPETKHTDVLSNVLPGEQLQLQKLEELTVFQVFSPSHEA